MVTVVLGLVRWSCGAGSSASFRNGELLRWNVPSSPLHIKISCLGTDLVIHREHTTTFPKVPVPNT